ncbi:hypothetical protein [Leeuwenhoekiella nanhaiensis]|uniref:Uncharacterized protein n=1 Tax=Leeuwenhoekiella nanhaiensis TaxID=1655491 RepID=A0A2G1VM68_9FLAO|nr:hypothetical protein [Leeuwenhoekiella nanhaiensis]PHQ27862.1 hypothetical protein CJ305_17815 [Leeuwenhoekiella nanhaiensis]
MARATKIEKEKRIRQCQKWLIDCETDTDILKKCQSKWGITRRQSENYLKDAYDGFRKDEEIKIESKRARRIARLNKLIKDMDDQYRKTPQGMNAIGRIEKMIIRLEGSESPRQHQVETKTADIKPTKFINATADR